MKKDNLFDIFVFFIIIIVSMFFNPNLLGMAFLGYAIV